MKNIATILILLIFLPLKLSAQAEKLKGEKYHLKGKLIREMDHISACGYFAFAHVIEMEILEFSDSTYSQKSIPVIVTCPDFYSEDFFKVGNIYELNLADENQANFGWTISDGNKLREKYNLRCDLWVLEMKKIQ